MDDVNIIFWKFNIWRYHGFVRLGWVSINWLWSAGRVRSENWRVSSSQGKWTCGVVFSVLTVTEPQWCFYNQNKKYITGQILVYNTTNLKQVLQQEAYPAIWSPVDAQNSAIPGAIPPKYEKTCLRCGRTTVQNFTPIGKTPAEKSITVQNEWMKKAQ